jgi:hypothetical protein
MSRKWYTKDFIPKKGAKIEAAFSASRQEVYVYGYNKIDWENIKFWWYIDRDYMKGIENELGLD